MNTKKILTDDEIIDLIIKYVDEKLYNYAVMIDGEWGCGKTFFVTKKLIKKLEAHENKLHKRNLVTKKLDENTNKKRNVIYISLYGIKSVEDVSKKILINSYISNNGEVLKGIKKGVEFVGELLPTVFDLVKSIKKIDFNYRNTSKTIKKFLPVKNSILIFDDLERCDCPINEILGLIIEN